MSLTDDQLQHYEDHGFIIVEGLLTADDLRPAMDDIEAHVGALADALFDAGHIPETYGELGFFERLGAMEQAYGGTAALFHVSGLLGRGIAALWGSPKILAIVEQLIGPDIAGHPVCNVRSKTPRTELMTVPWHQDTAYLLPGVEGTHQPAAWIPFLDVTAETGCMEVKRGGHKAGVFTHRIERDVANPKSWYLYVPEGDLAGYETVTCEMALGSALFINQLTPHRSLENHSDRCAGASTCAGSAPASRPAGKAISTSWRCAAGTIRRSGRTGTASSRGVPRRSRGSATSVRTRSTSASTDPGSTAGANASVTPRSAAGNPGPARRRGRGRRGSRRGPRCARPVPGCSADG